MNALLSLGVGLLILLQLLKAVPAVLVIGIYIKQSFVKKTECVYSIHTIIKALLSELASVGLMLSCIHTSNKGIVLSYTTSTQLAYTVFDLYYLSCLALFCYRSFSESISPIPKTVHFITHVLMETMILGVSFICITPSGTISATYSTTSVLDFIENFLSNTGLVKLDTFIFFSYLIITFIISHIQIIYMGKSYKKSNIVITYYLPIILIFTLLNKVTVGLGGVFLEGHYIFAFMFYIIRVSLEFSIIKKLLLYINEGGLN